MINAHPKLQTWMTLGRISNLPTVWTNTFAALLLTSSTTALPIPSSAALILLLTLVSLLYLAGMLLNDFIDSDWDQQHQNPRPIILGLVSRRQVGFATGILLSLALAALLYLSQLLDQPQWLLSFSLVLIGLIFAYNLGHKKYAHSVWFMGGCRSAVYLTAASSLAAPPELLWLCALLLGTYISGLTYLARQEHRNQILSYAPMLLMLSPVLLIIYADSIWFWLVLSLWLGWLGWNYWHYLACSTTRQVRTFIGAGLAALPLFDALVLTLAHQPLGSLLCVLVFYSLPYLQRWVKPT